MSLASFPLFWGTDIPLAFCAPCNKITYFFHSGSIADAARAALRWPRTSHEQLRTDYPHEQETLLIPSQAAEHGFKLGQLPGAWVFQVSQCSAIHSSQELQVL